MSHFKNVEAFGKLEGICIGFGDDYKPIQPNLQVENLSGKLTNARAALSNVSDAKTSFENAINRRAVAFKEISTLASRIFVALKSSGALSQTVDDARMMVRKIKGRSAAANRTPVPSGEAGQQAQATMQAPRRSRATGADYDSVAYHFEKLLQTVGSELLYSPFVSDLQLQQLRVKLDSFRALNNAAVTAAAQWGKARRDRNTLLYTGSENLYGTAMAVKQLVKAAFGHESEAAHAVSHIRMNKPAK
jgi:hypothetical protein